jgi:DNA polymerase III delta prime subunit
MTFISNVVLAIFLFSHASRGIDVVRDRIKGFAREKVDLPDGKHKIIILDEVDSMTESAQQVEIRSSFDK